MPKRTEPDPTLPLPLQDQQRLGRGPVYQAVAKQLRAMVTAGALDKDLDAGAMAAARAAAHSVDISGGRNPTGRPAAGMQQAALHRALLDWLDKLGGTSPDDDPFTEFLNGLNDDRTTQPHPEV